MSGICNISNRKGGPGCDHRTIGVLLAGEQLTWEGMEAQLDAMPWGATEKNCLLTYLLKFCRVQGITLDNLKDRIVLGEEATNVKQYSLLAKDVTKTNIGTAYVDIPPGANGERSLVDFTGCTEFRLIVSVNHITAAAGQLRFRIVRDSDSAVLYESPSLAASAGEKEADTASDGAAVNGWLPLPAAASGLGVVRFQGKSSVAADDPVVRRAILLVR